VSDTLNILRWNNGDGVTKIASIGSTAGYVTFKDEDLQIPQQYKRVYGLRMTYKIAGTVAKTAAISVATDGGALGTNGIPTGNLTRTSLTAWQKDDILFTTIKSALSCQVKVITNTASGVYEINDLGLELRPIYRRAT
jgi:hypothetical protein